MSILDFLNTRSKEEKSVFETLHSLICRHDKTISAEIGSIMSVKEAIVYKEDNVFKYGIAATKNHFSYHSMIMYAHPDILETFKKKSSKVKFQKGCFNFKSLDEIDLLKFESFLKSSAQIDFKPVINHYKKKRR